MTIEKPQIRLVKNAKDEWNFASFASNSASSPSTSSTSASSVPDLVVGKFAIVDGELTVASATTGRQSNYTKVEVKAQELSLNNQFPLQVSITLPGNGSMSLDGKIGPVAQGNATETPLDLNLKVNDFDLSKSGFLDPRAGIRGITNLEAALHASTGKARLNGTVKLAKLQIFRGGAPAGVPITVDFDVDYDLKSSSGTLNRGTVHVGKAQTQLQGSFQQKGPAELVDLTVKGAAMPVSDLQAALPAAGVILPKGSELQDGTANLNLHAVGPADKIVITGSTGLDNAKLAGFDLGSSFAAVSKITGGNLSSPDTVIQHFTTNVRVAPEGIAANNILANIQHLGDVTGNGTLNAANELDFKMDMKIGGKIGVPFTVTGNSSKPKITPDFSSMLKGSLGGAKALTSSAGSGLKKGVGGLFKKK